MSVTNNTANSLTKPHSIPLLGALTLPLFAGTMFISALLMFSVQPMFAKIVLPHLGGSPSVWAVAMVFFQTVLLCGYAYAHMISRYLSSPRGVIVHILILLVAMVSLPIGLAHGWSRPPEEGVAFWVLGVFAVSVGLPFFAISGNAPLLQAWFARTGHTHASDPYFLYGASNIGSLLALLSYPVIVEPFFPVQTQSEDWAVLYSVLVALVGVSGLFMLLQRTHMNGAVRREDSLNIASVSWSRRLHWIVLAFIPSGLLVAFTNHISTDVAAAPFLWVIPLSLFLLTFIIAFQHKPVIPHKWMLALQPILVAVLLVTIPLDVFSDHILISLGVTLVSFFVLAMVCHGELIRLRPRAENLTEFYLLMSFGGMLGGIFTGLVAPMIFSSVSEYPLLILLSLAARPDLLKGKADTWRREGMIALAVLGAIIAVVVVQEIISESKEIVPLLIGVCLLGCVIALSRENAVRLFLQAGVLVVVIMFILPVPKYYESIRGFFGVNKVLASPRGDFRLLLHGTTIHGAQRIDANGKPVGSPPEPLTYYNRKGAFADVIEAIRAHRPLRNVAAVGLGTGSLACYKQPGETWKFFEIDPLVVQIARDPKRFTFLSGCAPDVPVIIGDARLTLSDEKAAAFDLMFLDAFSSDAIPVHLLTIDAIRSYLEKLSEDGVLLFHISNRYMNLVPVLSAAARHLSLAGRVHYPKPRKGTLNDYKTDSLVVVLSRSDSNLGRLSNDPRWLALPIVTQRPWTDDFSNILGAILRGGAYELN